MTKRKVKKTTYRIKKTVSIYYRVVVKYPDGSSYSSEQPSLKKAKRTIDILKKEDLET